jgi:hypothetical protein
LVPFACHPTTGDIYSLHLRTEGLWRLDRKSNRPELQSTFAVSPVIAFDSTGHQLFVTRNEGDGQCRLICVDQQTNTIIPLFGKLSAEDIRCLLYLSSNRLLVVSVTSDYSFLFMFDLLDKTSTQIAAWGNSKFIGSVDSVAVSEKQRIAFVCFGNFSGLCTVTLDGWV